MGPSLAKGSIAVPMLIREEKQPQVSIPPPLYGALCPARDSVSCTTTLVFAIWQTTQTGFKIQLASALVR